MTNRTTIVALTLALLPAGLAAQRPGAPPAQAQAQQRSGAMENPEPAHYETEHQITVQGTRVQYNAVVGSIILKDGDEKPTGEMYYTAYFRTNGEPAAQRPVIFSYNGGPGSASFWLHMGIMGPRRVVTPDVGPQGPPPYPLVDNDYTLLDKADIVMIDPIGTGFSHTLNDTEGSTFWGLDEDAASITQFIRRWLSEHNRWNSPRYLLGESYGTTRSAVLSRHLQRANIDLNGIVLVSAVLDFQTLSFPEGMDVPYIVNLPSYAAVAWYHNALPGERPAELQPFLDEVEHWAMNDYATALLAGSALPADRRAQVVRQMHTYTGLSERFIDDADLRVTAGEFEKELLKDRGEVVGRLDARFTGPTGDLLDRNPPFDPQSSAISSAYTSVFNTYLRTELGYDGDREYTPSGAVRGWNWERRGFGFGGGFGGSIPNVAPDLRTAIQQNPSLEVLLVTGTYDLATPYFAAVWTMDHMGLPPELRDNIQRADFRAGHMMYVESSLLQQWRDTIAGFIDRTR